MLGLGCPRVLCEWSQTLPFRWIPGGLTVLPQEQERGGSGSLLQEMLATKARSEAGGVWREEGRQRLEERLFAAVVEEVAFEQDEIVTATGVKVVEQRVRLSQQSALAAGLARGWLTLLPPPRTT